MSCYRSGPPSLSPKISALLNLLEIGQTFRSYTEGTALVFGIFGNTMVVLVMGRKAMRSFTTGIYFIALAVSDTINLLAGVPHDLAGYTRSGYGNSYSVLTCQVSAAINENRVHSKKNWKTIIMTAPSVLVGIFTGYLSLYQSPIFSIHSEDTSSLNIISIKDLEDFSVILLYYSWKWLTTHDTISILKLLHLKMVSNILTPAQGDKAYSDTGLILSKCSTSITTVWI